MTNTEELERWIKKSGLKKCYIAEQVGLSRSGLSLKINNHREFRQLEIEKLCKVLHIVSLQDKENIFFAKK